MNPTPDVLDALAAYAAEHKASGRKGPWRGQLMQDWMSDHRRQWGELRRIRNTYAGGLQSLLAKVKA